MTRSELVKKMHGLSKFSNRTLLWVLVYLVFFGCFLWWADLNKDSISERAFGLIFLFGLIGGLYFTLIVGGIFARRYRQKLGLYCPNCKKDLMLHLAIASGRCGRCGAVILEDWNK